MQLILGRWHIQISKFGLSTKDRVYKVYTRRRKNNHCVQCGRKINNINHLTGIHYRKCAICRKKECLNSKLRIKVKKDDPYKFVFCEKYSLSKESKNKKFYSLKPIK